MHRDMRDDITKPEAAGKAEFATVGDVADGSNRGGAMLVVYRDIIGV